jgi:hypothetical protein
MDLRYEAPATHSLEALAHYLGRPDDSLLEAILDVYTREGFTALGAQIESERVIADTSRIYSHAFDVWSKATPALRDALVGFSPELLAVGVDRALALKIAFDESAGEHSSEETLSDPKQIGARSSYNRALLLREQAKTVLRTIASRNEALRLHVDSLIGTGDDADSLAASLDQMAELSDEFLEHDGDPLSTRVKLARLSREYVAKLVAAANDVRASAAQARASVRKLPAGHDARKAELDFLDGVNLHVLGEVVHAFEAAHDLEAEIPRLAPIATRRLLGRRSKNTLAKRGAALATNEAPARR